MDLRYSASDERFRADLRAWLSDALPKLPAKPPLDDWPARRSSDTAWQRTLYDAGYAGVNWPREVGGRGGSAPEHPLLLEEAGRSRAPLVGVELRRVLHAGPTPPAEGGPAQQPP